VAEPAKEPATPNACCAEETMANVSVHEVKKAKEEKKAG
jgi:hypothetical protein